MFGDSCFGELAFAEASPLGGGGGGVDTPFSADVVSAPGVASAAVSFTISETINGLGTTTASAASSAQGTALGSSVAVSPVPFAASASFASTDSLSAVVTQPSWVTRPTADWGETAEVTSVTVFVPDAVLLANVSFTIDASPVSLSVSVLAAQFDRGLVASGTAVLTPAAFAVTDDLSLRAIPTGTGVSVPGTANDRSYGVSVVSVTAPSVRVASFSQEIVALPTSVSLFVFPATLEASGQTIPVPPIRPLVIDFTFVHSLTISYAHLRALEVTD